MDQLFKDDLFEWGINASTMEILEEELIVDWGIFKSLSVVHLEKLLPRLTLGQHALLSQIWENNNTSKLNYRDTSVTPVSEYPHYFISVRRAQYTENNNCFV